MTDNNGKKWEIEGKSDEQQQFLEKRRDFDMKSIWKKSM